MEGAGWKMYLYYKYIFDLYRDLYLDESVTRQSTCELECDIVAPDILNRQEVDGRSRNQND